MCSHRHVWSQENSSESLLSLDLGIKGERNTIRKDQRTVRYEPYIQYCVLVLLSCWHVWRVQCRLTAPSLGLRSPKSQTPLFLRRWVSQLCCTRPWHRYPLAGTLPSRRAQGSSLSGVSVSLHRGWRDIASEDITGWLIGCAIVARHMGLRPPWAGLDAATGLDPMRGYVGLVRWAVSASPSQSESHRSDRAGHEAAVSRMT